jgi:hypothetical protein
MAPFVGITKQVNGIVKIVPLVSMQMGQKNGFKTTSYIVKTVLLLNMQTGQENGI